MTISTPNNEYFTETGRHVAKTGKEEDREKEDKGKQEGESHIVFVLC